YASLMKQFTNVDPYQCVLCGSRMVFSSAEAGVRAEELLARRHHRQEKERWLLAA
ncbi:IS91 family transposase, partial [Enterobacteriaceae bacterium ML5]